MADSNQPHVAEDQPREQGNATEQLTTDSSVNVRPSRRHRRRERRILGLCVKKKNGNLLASVFDMTVVVLLSAALIESRWFALPGGSCHRMIFDGDIRRDVQQLGLILFFPAGGFTSSDSSMQFYYKFSHEGKIN